MNTKLENSFLRETEVAEITGLSRLTRGRLEKRDEFPRRYRISDGIAAYKENEILEWIETRPVCDDVKY